MKKKRIALFLSVVMLVTMNASVFAEEKTGGHYEHDTVISEESQEIESVNVNENREEVSDAENVLENEYPDGYKKFLEKWSYNVEDEGMGSVGFELEKKCKGTDGEKFSAQLARTDNGSYYRHFSGDSYEAYNCEISINGVIGYGNANELYQDKYYINRTRTINLRGADDTKYKAENGNKITIYIKDIPDAEKTDEEDANEYILKIKVSKALRDIVTVSCDQGIYIISNKDGLIVLTNDDDPYYALNEPTVSVNKMLSGYDVTYYTEIPYGGNNVKPTKYHNTCGWITVSGPGLEKTYRVEKAKLVRLKNAPKDQGPFPTVSNAAIQIIKLENAESKDAKNIQRELKKATKVNKNKSWEEQALPVIIYPRRVTTMTQTLKAGKDSNPRVYLSGKKGKYTLTLSSSRLKFKIKNGKKDSFKTGVHSITYDKETGTISVNSADVWTGPHGLPVSTNRVKLNIKD